MNPRLHRLTSAVAFLPFLSMVGTVIGIRADFEAVASGPPVEDVARVGSLYACFAGLVGMLIGLVAVLLYRPRRSR